MKMNSGRFFVFILILFVFANACKKENRFTIHGKITHAEGETIYLDELLISEQKTLDSAKINKKGEFTFKGQTPMPAFYLLRFPSGKIVTLLVDSLENITLTADYANFDKNYLIEGSKGSALVKELCVQLNTTRKKIDSLEQVLVIYSDKPDFETKKMQIETEIKNIRQQQSDFSKDFVMKNPFSMASIYALYQKFNPAEPYYIINELQPMRVAASALNSVYPNSAHVKALYANTLQWLKNEQNAKLQQFIQEHGENSPDITLPDPYGKEFSLSALRGKYVLLQFWAGADKNSRVMNPVLTELYQKYKNSGFEIFQVSLDNDRSAWIDAIDEDKLNWINVSDLKGCNQAVAAYNVKTLPCNYLLDKTGVIVARNLQGPNLNSVVSGIFK
jgi:peroxiredoxin